MIINLTGAFAHDDTCLYRLGLYTQSQLSYPLYISKCLLFHFIYERQIGEISKIEINELRTLIP